MSKEFWESGWPWTMAFGERRRAFPFALGFASKGRFFEPGETRLAVLSLLSEGPTHGYQLMKELGERSGGMYHASAGSIYPALQQLENDSLIRVKQEGGRKIYSLTVAGRKELDRDPEAVRRIWERAEECEDWGQSFGPESMMVLPLISPLVKASLRAAGRGGVEKARQILDRARKDLEAI
ncbi:MAG TPA: PadR family transcriptional regulator [Bryobacteraceae bacterium]|nr:PadR family transcriptional regulator [Bryobacteraceae bacterium]